MSVTRLRSPALFGVYGAVNAVSRYVEHGGVTFDGVHVEAAARVARLARASGVERLIHVSGIGADPVSSSPYIASRGRGEIGVYHSFPSEILIRPAVMFGQDDVFLTTIARLLRILPVYPLFGRGEMKLQPVYVEDVAEGVARVLSGAGENVACYEFGGARSTLMENWSKLSPIGSGLARGLYRCHFRFGEFSPWGPSSCPALL
jgi:uncharacterized protein YbjT (DUF2867 family)